MKRAVLTACFLAVLAVLWLAMGSRARRSAVSPAERGDPAAEPRAAVELVEGGRPRGGSERVAPERSAPVGEGESGAAAAAPAEGGLRIVSALGLPLEHAHVTGADGLEREVALGTDGACTQLALPCDVRAAGHRKARVEAPTTVKLQPVFGLVLRAPGLSTRLVGASCGWGDLDPYLELDGVIACGITGEDALALAIDWGPPGYIQEHTRLSFWTADNRRYEAVPERGKRGTFEERLELPSTDLASLILTAVCPQGCTSPPLMELWPSFSVPWTALPEEAREWGTLQVQDRWPAKRALGEAGSARAAVGQEYGATARCPDCGSYGRRLFVAQPGRSTLEVALDQRAVLLRATVDRASWEQVRLDWTFERERDRKPSWDPMLVPWAGGAYLPVDPDGSLELRLPDKLPSLSFAAWPMPPLLRLRVHAGASEKLLLYVDLPPGGPVDLGALSLSLPAPHVVLAPGHGIADAQRVTARGGGELLRFGIYHPGDCRPRADGALEIRFDPKMSTSDPAAFAGESLPHELLVADGQLAARAFAWDGSAYAALPAESRNLRVDCSALPEGAHMARFGVRWHGLDQELGWGAQAGTSTVWSLAWPRGSDLLWWSLDDPPVFSAGRGGTVPLTPELGVLRIPSGL